MDAVRGPGAGSGKATLYRQWQGKPQAGRRGRGDGGNSKPTAELRGHRQRPVLRAAPCTSWPGGRVRAEADTGVHERRRPRPPHGNADLAAGSAGKMLIEAGGCPAPARCWRGRVERGEIPRDVPAGRSLPAHALVGAMMARKILEDRFADADYMIRYVDRGGAARVR